MASHQAQAAPQPSLAPSHHGPQLHHNEDHHTFISHHPDPVFGKPLVLICSILTFGMALGLPSSLSVLFLEWQESFGASRAHTSAIHSTCFGIVLGGAVLSGFVMNKIGPRWTILLGSFLASTGLFISAFATSIDFLIVTTGVMTGFGYCLVQLPTIPCMTAVITKYRSISISMCLIAVALIGIGNRYLLRYIVDSYTWRGACIITAGITLNTSLTGLVITSLLPVSKSFILMVPAHQNDNSKDDDGTHDNLHHNKSHVEHSSQITPRNTSPISPVKNILSNNVDRQCNNEYYSGKSSNSVINDNDEHLNLKYSEKDSFEFFNERRKSVDKTIDFNNTSLRSSENEMRDDKNDNTYFDLDKELKSDIDTAVGCVHDGGDGEYNVDEDDASSGGDIERRIEHSNPNIYTNNNIKSSNFHSSHKRPYNYNHRHNCLGKWSFLMEPTFILLSVHIALCTSSIYSFCLIQMDYANSLGFDQSTGVTFLTTVFVASLLGRLFIGVGDLFPYIPSAIIETLYAIPGSIAMLVLSWVQDQNSVLVLLSVTGFSVGGLVAIYPKCALDIPAVTKELYPVALGFFCTMEGLMGLVITVFIGYSVDLTGSYTLILMLMGGVSMASTLILGVGYLYFRRQTTLQ